MFIYEKKLQYPIKIKNPSPKMASIIVSQLGGPDGELGAATRYLCQRFSMPYSEVVGILTDVGTEELSHVEMISTILYQLTRNLTPEQIVASGFDKYFVDHTTGTYPPAAEQKARVTYDNILRLCDDPDVKDAIRFLRAREIVHYQRFGDALRVTQDHLNSKNFYAYNPGFDRDLRRLGKKKS